MATILVIILGGIVGLIYGAGVGIDRRLNGLINFVVGAIGGVLGVWFFGGVLGLVTLTPAINVLLAILWTIIGALIVLAIVNAIAGSIYEGRAKRDDRESRTRRSYARDYDRDDYDVEEEKTTTTKRRKK